MAHNVEGNERILQDRSGCLYRETVAHLQAYVVTNGKQWCIAPADAALSPSPPSSERASSRDALP